MADTQDFRIFISWAAPLARGIAEALHGWLPTMFDNIDAWFSTTDIPAGTAWFGEIQKRLDSSDYGIIVVTTENLERPWLNFEAGALSKKLGEDRTRVTPVLVNFNQIGELTGHPLGQYNAVLLDKNGIWKLCESIAESAGRNVVNVQVRFEQMWPTLETEIQVVKEAAGEQPAPPDVSEPQQLQALADSVRSMESVVARLVRGNAVQAVLPDELPLMQRVSQLLGGNLKGAQLDTNGDETTLRVDVADGELSADVVMSVLSATKSLLPDKPAKLVVRAGDTVRRHVMM